MDGNILKNGVLQDVLCNLLDCKVKVCTLSCSELDCSLMKFTLFMALLRGVNQRRQRGKKVSNGKLAQWVLTITYTI